MKSIYCWGLFILLNLSLFAQQSQTWVKVQFDPSLPYLQMLQDAGIIDSEREGAAQGWMLRRDFERYTAAHIPLEMRQEAERPFVPLHLTAVAEDDTLGQILLMQLLPPAVEGAIGLGYLNDHLYLSDFTINDEKIYRIDPANNFQVVNTFPAPGAGSKNPWGVASNGRVLYIADGIQNLIFITDDSLSVEYIIGTPGPLAAGLGYRFNQLWNSDLGDFTNGVPQRMYVSDTVGTLLNQYTTNITNNGVTAHDSAVIVARNKNNGQVVIGYDPATYQQIYSFPSPLEYPNGLAFDGTYLWMSGNHLGGRYIVKISLGLSPPAPAPRLQLTADSLNFGTVPPDSAASLMLGLSNIGDTTLVIDSLFTGSAVFSVSPGGNLALPPGAGIELSLTFTPPAEGLFRDTLSIISNAAGQDTAQVLLIGEGELPVGLNGNVAMPEDFALLPNYPNPFNPSTTITYRLGRTAEVELVIFNPLGQQIRILQQQRQPAGIYRIVWDGRDDSGTVQASGVYYYRLKAGVEFTDIRKMVFLK